MNEGLAESLEWQARCRDLETVNEELRESRESALTQARTLAADKEFLFQRVTELEEALRAANQKIGRLVLHLQQGIELWGLNSDARMGQSSAHR